MITGKYEERIAVATNTGVHVFNSSLAVVPYDEWTHIAIVCAEDPRLKKNGLIYVHTYLYTLSMNECLCMYYVSYRPEW